MVAFYAQFVSKGNLVFDVGANVGEYTEVFLELGAQVVAVEPNPSCASLLEQIRPRERVVVKRAALGNTQSESILHVCDLDGLSTMSPDWLGVAQNLPKLAGRDWSRSIKVPVTTLDALITEYGRPQFIKIDVEGYEHAVLSGLSRLPTCLSFEYHNEFANAAKACVRENCFSPAAQFNLTLGNPLGWRPQPLKFALDEWVSSEKMAAQLEKGDLLNAETYGEIFARELP
jgi:FkbM family methyltransferase